MPAVSIRVAVITRNYEIRKKNTKFLVYRVLITTRDKRKDKNEEH